MKRTHRKLIKRARPKARRKQLGFFQALMVRLSQAFAV